jgi:hypothetical protein
MGYAMTRVENRREALSDYFVHGHTGFGWSARRSVLDAHGFYDCQILGNGDFVMAHAMYGNEDFWNGHNWECDRLSPRLLEHIIRWGKAFHDDVRGSVSYVPGRVLHMWHGNQSDRHYNRRLDVLKECDFDPVTDLARDDNDCWVWNCDKPLLQEWASNYFVVRREE